MDKAFKELKRKAESGELLKLYRELGLGSRYALGQHKKTRLKLAGVGDSRTLLHNDVAERHSRLLADELKAKAKKLGRDANKRLKFVTILEATVDPTIEAVAAAVERLEASYSVVFGDIGLWSRGAIELEIVNLSILERISRQSDNEARKLNVLNDLREIVELEGLHVAEGKEATKVLVHCHTVVDLGQEVEKNLEEIKRRIKHYGFWNTARYQIKFDSLFKAKTTANNLDKIAAYVTKGGNENLRYNAGFGRDLAEDLEAKIWREGLGRSDKSGELIEDERGLTMEEVRRLDELYAWLMKRRKDRRGYIISSNGIKKKR